MDYAMKALAKENTLVSENLSTSELQQLLLKTMRYISDLENRIRLLEAKLNYQEPSDFNKLR